MPNVWVVRADTGMYTQACVDGGFTGIGWAEVGDLSAVRDQAQLAGLYEQHADSEEVKGTRDTNVNTIWRFVDAISPGDWLITPARERRNLQYGKVQSGYSWLAQPDESCPYRHRRNVEWSADQLDRQSLSLAFQNTLGSALTVFNARHITEFLERIGEPVDDLVQPNLPQEPVKPYELALGRIMSLTPTQFEELVGHLLAAMGFDVTVTPPARDGGVDFYGTLSVSSAAQIDVVGQVKRHKLESKIRPNLIRDLRGRVPNSAQGTFVTTSDFTRPARDTAEEPGFPRVGLINGEQLVDLLTQHWTDIPVEYRDLLGLKPILVPA